MSGSPELDAAIMPFIERWNDRFICIGIEVGEEIIEAKRALDDLEGQS